jgi:hypothetical protein
VLQPLRRKKDYWHEIGVTEQGDSFFAKIRGREGVDCKEVGEDEMTLLLYFMGLRLEPRIGAG